MKKMKTTIAATVALAACLSTQVFGAVSSTGNVKQDTITFALTVQGQASVSTSATVANAGNFSQGPLYYKTATKKMTQADILKAIAYVLHGHNGGFYTSQASLVLVQGELGGFFNINDGLAQSYEDFDSDGDGSLTGGFNTYGTDGTYQDDYSTQWAAYYEMDDGFPDADSTLDPWSYVNALETYLDNNSRTSISDGQDMYAQLDTGRHFLPVPLNDTSTQDDPGAAIATSYEYPVGHMQPWGQIYVKDPGHKDTSGNPLCENVTFFFFLEVEECYDCFYLSSFISDATFKDINGSQSGPPCCTAKGFLTGKGVDRYYLSLSFDNTINNSYLNPAWTTNSDFGPSNGMYYYEYVGFTGLTANFLSGNGNEDGLTPDILYYSDPIRSHLGLASPYECRFTLNGIVTYSWTLTLINSTDAAYDFVGTANYDANGYGFIGLVCSLITGTAQFSEKVVKDVGCCDDENWYDNEYNYTSYNGQGNYYTTVTGWYGPGDGEEYGYFNPDRNEYNPYPYYNIVGGEQYPNYGSPSSLYRFDLPYQNESPLNPAAALTYHGLTQPHIDRN